MELAEIDERIAKAREERDWTMLATLLEERMKAAGDSLELLQELLHVYRDELADDEKAADVARRMVGSA